MYSKFLFLSALLFVSIIDARTLPKEAPETWKEHWFEHDQLLSRVFVDADVAVYFDSDVDPTVTWPNEYLARVWRYVKETYGDFGPETELYAIFHTGKYGGGHPSSYFDPSHDNHNVIDVGSPDTTAWTSGEGWDLDIVTHEVAHVVEGGAKGIHNSPAFGIWGDSKWAEIFGYDVYLALGMPEDALRIYDQMIQGSDNFPRPNTFWFRDWFLPIYSGFGGNKVLNNYFEMLAQHFPQEGNEYSRDMNMGEFIHFWSGAAQSNLKEQATIAFGWSQEYEDQFNEARTQFSAISYP